MNEEKKSFFKSKVFHIIIIVFCVLALVGIVGLMYFININKSAILKTEKVETEIDNLKVGLFDDSTAQDIGPTKNYDQSSYIFRNVYDSLVTYSEDGKLIPDLATNWSNPDDTTWKFFLKKDVKFSDGKTFTAADVKYTFDTIKADQESQLNEYFSEITEVKVVNPEELEIKTESPAPYLISKLSFLLIIPNGSQNITFANTPGTGPFTYNKKETVEGKQLVFDRNNLYQGSKPKAKKVTVSVYSDNDQQAVEDFKNGKLQVVNTPTKESFQAMSDVARAKRLSVGANGVYYLVLNNNDNAQKYISVTPSPLKDQKVRLAMWEALNTDGLINETMKGMATPADQVVTRQTFGFNPKIKRPEYNLDDAKKLMEESGNQKGFKIKLFIAEKKRYIGEYVQKAWKNIGIDVELEIGAEETYIDRFMAHDFAVGFISWTEDSRDGQNTLLTLFGDSDQNMGSFKNEKLAKAMSDLSSEVNQQKRQKLIQDSLQIIRDEVPVIPLYSTKINYFVSKDVEWQPSETLDIYFKNAVGLSERKVEQKKSDIFSNIKLW